MSLVEQTIARLKKQQAQGAQTGAAASSGLVAHAINAEIVG